MRQRLGRRRRREADLSDAAIIRASFAEPERFVEIFERHAPAIQQYAARRVGSTASEDILSEVFAVAFARRSDFVPPEHESARLWLFGIARNHVFRHYRTNARLDNLETALAQQRQRQVSEDQVVVELQATAEALRTLPEIDRETLLLVTLGELSYEEAAEALGVPIGTIRSRVNRARKRLQQHTDLQSADAAGEVEDAEAATCQLAEAPSALANSPATDALARNPRTL